VSSIADRFAVITGGGSGTGCTLVFALQQIDRPTTCA
jgi:hypothetical protein